MDNAESKETTRQKFRTERKLEGKTATGIQVPAEVVAALGKTKKPPVRVTINGHTYRSTVAAYGNVYMIPVSAEHREKAGVSAGEMLDVELELDTDPREVTAPPDFAAALERDQQAQQFYDGLSYSNKRRIVLSIEDAKTPETRQRRIDKAINALHERKV
jgi:hypothetical protein